MEYATRNPDFEQDVRASFARQAFMQVLNATLVDVRPGICIITAPLSADLTQQHGVAHAGVSFALGDSAAGYAALSLLPAGYEVMTSEMKIHLLAPASGQRLIATGSIIKSGKRLIIARAEVMAEGPDGAQAHVATLLGTMVPLAPQG